MLETIFSIILMILKIIGIIILAVLGLILTLILLLLFVPIRYKASAKKYEELKAKGYVSWLLHIVHVGIVYDGELRGVLRVFGIPVKKFPARSKAADEQSGAGSPESESRGGTDAEQSSAESQESESGSDEAAKQSSAGSQESERASVTATKQSSAGSQESERASVDAVKQSSAGSQESENASVDAVKQSSAGSQESENASVTATKQSSAESPESDSGGNTSAEQSGDENTDEKKRRSIRQIFETIRNKIKDIVNGIVEKVKNIYNKLRSLLQTASDVKSFIDNERNRTAFSFIKERLIHALKHIAPRRMKGYVRFGLEDPSSTGYVLALLGAFYGQYGNNVNIVPDFTEKCFEGDFMVKGRIRLFTIGLDALKVIMNKDVKYLRKSYNKLKKGFEERRAA